MSEGIFGPPKSIRKLNPASTNTRPRRKNSKPARINMVPQEFENLIEDQGVFVRITPVVLCPNRTALGDTNHVLDCPLCGGDQLIEAVDLAVEDWAFIQGIKLDKEFNVQGIFDLKDAQITTKQKIKMAYWYKVEVLDFSMPFNQLLKRGSGDTDRLRYIPTFNGTVRPEIKETDEANAEKAPDIPWILIDSDGKSYKLDQDFAIKDRDIKWKSPTKRPKAGSLYSFQYPVLPTFRVLELMHEHRYYYVDFKRHDKVPVHLPQQAIIRWDYLAKGAGNHVPAPAEAP